MAENLIGRHVRGNGARWKDFRRDTIVPVLLRQHLELRQLPQETHLLVRARISRRFSRSNRWFPFQMIVLLKLAVRQREAYWRHGDSRVRQYGS